MIRYNPSAMKKEKGAIMVEAIIIFPIVLMTVMFLLYLGLIKLQDMAIMYQVQRTAHQGAMVVASPGYAELGKYGAYDTKQIDRIPIDFESTDAADAYYQAYHENIAVLYREIFGYGAWTSQDEIQNFLEDMGEDTMVLAGVSLLSQDASVRRGLFGTKVKAEVYFGFPSPGPLRYFGYDGTLRFKQGAAATAVNPSGFVRNVDLAGDAIVVVSEKLGIDGDLNKILEGIKEYLF